MGGMIMCVVEPVLLQSIAQISLRTGSYILYPKYKRKTSIAHVLPLYISEIGPAAHACCGPTNCFPKAV
jgi:hypothetical protein